VKKFIVLLLSLLTVILIIGCATPAPATPAAPKPTPAPSPTTAPAPAPAPTPKQQYGGVLKVVLGTGISTLGAPSDAGLGGIYDVVAAPEMEPLLRHDNQFRLRGRLAESYELGPEGKSIIFHLRKGVKFQDGTLFNAEAAKFNIEKYTVNNVRPSYLKSITSYDVVDEYTLRLNLSEFNLDLLMSFVAGVGTMGSPKAIQTPTTPEKMAEDHMVGTGAFSLVSYKRDVNAIYKKADSYWQPGKPYLDGIEMIQIADPVTATIAFEKGDVNFLYRISNQVAADLAAKGFKISRENLNPIGYITPDGANKDSPFFDKRVREAVEYALDKKALAQGIGKGYFQVATQFAFPGDATYMSDLSVRDFNPAKAKQLLAEAGYANGFKTKIIAHSASNRDFVVAVQTYLKEVGITAELDIADAGRFATLMHEGWQNGIIVNYYPINAMLPTKIAMFFSTNLNRATNVMASAYKPPQWEEKLTATIAQYDETKRVAQVKELLKMMHDDVMGIPLWSSPQLYASDKKIQDAAFGVGHGQFWEPENAWLSK
jgi:peptide/nickel transport system substrate-binding protein